jgi:putative Mn2+ efflux pump MntP
MDIATAFLIALGLAMDAFAVSVASGLGIRNLRVGHAVRIGVFFGAFQAIMPVVGWLAGLSLKGFVADFAPWAAFAILAFIGAKMIYEAAVIEKAERDTGSLNVFVLVGLSVATSIDALAVGVTFAFLKVAIITPVVVIGLVTFFMSCSGVCMGRTFGNFSEKKIEVLGGLILIAIGVKILVEHLYFRG